MFDSLLFDLMFVVLLGIISQWVAWRFSMPAIVVMSIAGLLVGPIFGFINPQETMGDLFSPIISLAVAIILFEGSLNLDFKEIKGFSKPVGRIVTVGAFIAWIGGSLAAHYVAGLSWAVAWIIGGLFIVTGPTVILPLLRQARLKPRPAAILKWEGIVVDPFGALLAVFAYEFIKYINGEVNFNTLLMFFAASGFAVFIGCFAGWFIGRSLERGGIPEFLKAPVLFAVVIFTFVLSDEIMHETGLLAVTAMGMTMANMRISSLDDIKHFKENISVLLISGIFVMLTASLSPDVLLQIMNPNIIAFVVVMLIVVRPLSIWISTIGTELNYREKLLIGWIAPRGIVALTVSGYFATILLDNGYQDAEILTALTFALVFGTVVLHGFSISWVAKKLNLATTDDSGVLLVGGTKFAAEFAEAIQKTGNDVMIVDRNYSNLVSARNKGIKSYTGNILLEQTELNVDLTPYQYMIAMTHSDRYNANVCADFGPDLGYDHLYQTETRRVNDEAERPLKAGQSLFIPALPISELERRIIRGDVMRRTLITKQYSYTNYLRDRDNQSVLLFIEREDGSIEFFSEDKEIQAFAGDTVVALATPQKTIERVKERLDEEGAAKEENMKEVVDYYVEPTSLEETKGYKDLPGEAPPTIK
ncbi:sodium:proton antiporter [Savagea sp. SN6]|uniref:Sodium:proton antiporter n=1 Tax=Savagea serpentis TaxID=2785297 RepID=A0A8J7G539_9BACL|nr:sodium:proton antiporter [Savagea serpentis]MBF4501462.1 sodium:proton antiporter [Savagea serpentis]